MERKDLELKVGKYYKTTAEVRITRWPNFKVYPPGTIVQVKEAPKVTIVKVWLPGDFVDYVDIDKLESYP